MQNQCIFVASQQGNMSHKRPPQVFARSQNATNKKQGGNAMLNAQNPCDVKLPTLTRAFKGRNT